MENVIFVNFKTRQVETAEERLNTIHQDIAEATSLDQNEALVSEASQIEMALDQKPFAAEMQAVCDQLGEHVESLRNIAKWSKNDVAIGKMVKEQVLKLQDLRSKLLDLSPNEAS